MRVDEVPAGLSAEDQLVYLTGWVARTRMMLLYAMVQLTGGLDAIQSGDPGDMTWEQLFELSLERVRALPEDELREGGLETLAAAQEARSEADGVIDGYWVLASDDPTVWTHAGVGVGMAYRMGREPSSAEGFVGIVNRLQAATTRVATLNLLTTRDALDGSWIVDGEERERSLKIVRGEFTMWEDGQIDLP